MRKFAITSLFTGMISLFILFFFFSNPLLLLLAAPLVVVGFGLACTDMDHLYQSNDEKDSTLNEKDTDVKKDKKNELVVSLDKSKSKSVLVSKELNKETNSLSTSKRAQPRSLNPKFIIPDKSAQMTKGFINQI